MSEPKKLTLKQKIEKIEDKCMRELFCASEEIADCAELLHDETSYYDISEFQGDLDKLLPKRQLAEQIMHIIKCE